MATASEIHIGLRLQCYALNESPVNISGHLIDKTFYFNKTCKTYK